MIHAAASFSRAVLRCAIDDVVSASVADAARIVRESSVAPLAVCQAPPAPPAPSLAPVPSSSPLRRARSSSACVAALSSLPAQRATRRLNIVHFSDVYNIGERSEEPCGGAPRFVTAVDSLIAEAEAEAEREGEERACVRRALFARLLESARRCLGVSFSFSRIWRREPRSCCSAATSSARPC
jgi:hypothetical protein